LEEAYVISQVRAGKADAFAEIVTHYEVPILRYLYRLTGDHEVAQDLTQDTFIKAYKGILKTKNDISFRAWLYRIATNNALQFRRRKRLLSFIPFTRSEEMNIPSAEDSAVRTDDRMIIEEVLLKVPQEQRICMVLHFVEGLKYREVAEIVGISEDAVRMRVARGRHAFLKIYNEKGVK
jgi:RNA polymerase sigma factor (sigma-70 family)